MTNIIECNGGKRGRGRPYIEDIKNDMEMGKRCDMKGAASGRRERFLSEDIACL